MCALHLNALELLMCSWTSALFWEPSASGSVSCATQTDQAPLKALYRIRGSSTLEIRLNKTAWSFPPLCLWWQEGVRHSPGRQLLRQNTCIWTGKHNPCAGKLLEHRLNSAGVWSSRSWKTGSFSCILPSKATLCCRILHTESSEKLDLARSFGSQ